MLVAEAIGDLALQAQGEDVAGALLLVVELGADAQELVVGAVELLALANREHAGVDEILAVFKSALHPPEPEQVLVIAQAAAAVLDVRLLQENGVARLLVPFALVAHAPFEEFLFMAVHAAVDEDFLELGEERFVAAEKARLEQRGLGPEIAVGLGDQLGHRARRVPDLKADVPKHVEHVLDEVGDLRGGLGIVGVVEEENVDVAVGIELAAPETADGQQRDARGILEMRLAVRFPRAGPDVAQHDGDDVGPLRTGRGRRRRAWCSSLSRWSSILRKRR